jgi:post-segregation antitoxin (ccd killing protein)
MIDIEIKLTLPDNLAREAQARGVLTPEALRQLIDAEVERRRKLDWLFTTMNQLANVDIPPLSNDELNAEIQAARAERRARRAGGA